MPRETGSYMCDRGGCTRTQSQEPAARIQSKRDLRGYTPGDATRDVLTRAQGEGMTCRKTDDFRYVSCTNNYNEFTDARWEELEFYSIDGGVITVIYRFKSGNDFRSLVKWISQQFATAPYDVSFIDIARWRLPDGSTLEFRKLAEASVLTLANQRVRERLRAKQEEKVHRINPTPHL